MKSAPSMAKPPGVDSPDGSPMGLTAEAGSDSPDGHQQLGLADSRADDAQAGNGEGLHSLGEEGPKDA